MRLGAQFITFEGGEGAGKTTQLRLLAGSFAAAGIGCIATREPGGCPAAEEIRQLLVNGEANRWLPETEALLMLAARFEHVSHTIKPALARGEMVLCDRFFDSTLVYQGLAKGLGEAWLSQLQTALLGQITPSLTLYFDIDPQAGLNRTHARAGNEGRFESMPLAFHQQVRAGFLALCERHPQRMVRIDAHGDVAQLNRAVLAIVNARFGLPLSECEAVHGT